MPKRASKRARHAALSAYGRAGGIARWANVEREPTVQVRVYESDAGWLKAQPGSTAQAVRRLMGLRDARKCDTLSAVDR